MEKKIALFVIYNHRYDRNIPIIEELYREKFRYIFHIVPFYDGEKKNVIPVYESSFRFQSYISQAYQHTKNHGFTHFFIIADDMILNPKLAESNLLEEVGIDENTCFITNFKELHVLKNNVYPLFYKIEKKGVEVKNILPSYSEAKQKFEYHGLDTSRIKSSLILRFMCNSLYNVITLKEFKRHSIMFLKEMLFLFSDRRLKYPLVWGYSDILIITKDVMAKFCTYCGAFAATDLFVEFAIPTSLILSTSNVKLEKDTKMKGLILGRGEEKKQFDKEYAFSLEKLMGKYPENVFYIHPIKHSEWK